MKIAKASPADIPEIMELIRLAVQEMHSRGLYQWDDHYPTGEIITGDVKAKNLHKITDGEKIAGIIVLNEQSVPQYSGLRWGMDDARPLIIHRLCIRPEYQGKGLSKKLMRFAEEYGLKNSYSSIRLDTSVSNEKALALYDSLNYRRTGIVTFRTGSFQCFEKVLKQFNS